MFDLSSVSHHISCGLLPSPGRGSPARRAASRSAPSLGDVSARPRAPHGSDAAADLAAVSPAVHRQVGVGFRRRDHRGGPAVPGLPDHPLPARGRDARARAVDPRVRLSDRGRRVRRRDGATPARHRHLLDPCRPVAADGGQRRAAHAAAVAAVRLRVPVGRPLYLQPAGARYVARPSARRRAAAELERARRRLRHGHRDARSGRRRRNDRDHLARRGIRTRRVHLPRRHPRRSHDASLASLR